jgi:hypothetical protein
VKPALLVIAGPNGGGKTTVTARLRVTGSATGIPPRRFLRPRAGPMRDARSCSRIPAAELDVEIGDITVPPPLPSPRDAGGDAPMTCAFVGQPDHTPLSAIRLLSNTATTSSSPPRAVT